MIKLYQLAFSIRDPIVPIKLGYHIQYSIPAVIPSLEGTATTELFKGAGNPLTTAFLNALVKLLLWSVDTCKRRLRNSHTAEPPQQPIFLSNVF